MRVTVNFQLKKSKARQDGKFPLYLRCTMTGKRFEISTGIFVDENTWQESNQKNKGKTEEAKIIKNRVDKVTAKIQDIYNQLESLGQPFDVFSIKNKFLGLTQIKLLPIGWTIKAAS